MADFSFASMYRRSLTLFCDPSGRVLEILNATGFYYPSLLRHISDHKNVMETFDFGGLKSLERAAEEGGPFPVRSDFVFSDFLEGFYTTLPTSVIEIRKAAPDRFAGVITVTQIIPNFFQLRPSSIIYVDNGDALLGFNETFHSFFRETRKAPLEMLGMPAADFISPTPGRIQKSLLPEFSPESAQGFSGLYEKDFRESPDLWGVGRAGAAGIAFSGRGLAWDNTGNGLSYLTFAPAVDTFRTDVMLTAEVTVLKGHAPLTVLGNRTFDPEYPDSPGYIAGSGPGGRGTVLKRQGFVIASSPEQPPAEGGRVLRFAKIGRSVFIFQDGKRLLGFYDHDFIFNSAAHVSLCLRGGCACAIQRVVVQARACRPLEAAGDLIVRLNVPGSDRYFLLNRFHNFTLNSSRPDAAGYFLQDITSIQDRVKHLTRQYREQLERTEQLSTLLREYREEREGFIGESPEMVNIRNKARVVADSLATVLIQGPTGTGKEVLARHIHDNSPLCNGPFIKVDCSTLPASLMESELFGHEKGAFTGAVDRKIGKMELSDKGTLFLDEVSNLTPEAQAKLLQFLQDFTITRVGGQKALRLEVRVIAASNLNLEDLVKKGTFREDLFYRLYVVAIYLPPLSRRKEDIPALCDHFVKMFSAASGKNISRIAPAAFKRIYAYEWPGNIRELRNAIQRAVLFCEGEEITENLIETGPPLSGKREPVTAPPPHGYHFFREFSLEDLKKLLEGHRGNVLKISRELGVTPRALYYHFRKNRIDPGLYRRA